MTNKFILKYILVGIKTIGFKIGILVSLFLDKLLYSETISI